jgi:hypothetical protein
MSDDRTIPRYSTRLWSEEVGMADPGANFDAPPVLGYSFGGRTLTTDVNTTLYAPIPPTQPVVEIATRQTQIAQAIAEVVIQAPESIVTSQFQSVQAVLAAVTPPALLDVATGQAQTSRAIAPVDGTGPLAVASATSRQGQRTVGYASAGAASDPPQTGTPIDMGAQITTVKLENTSTSAVTNQAFALGHVFALGNLPAAGAGIALQLPDGSSIASQLNVKALHADGSVRHAVISGVLPSLGASASQTLSIRRAPAAASAPAIGLPATLPSVSITISGAVYTASAQGATYSTWFAGPVCSDYIFNVPFVGAAGPHPTLTAQFSVRVFNTGTTRVDAVVEHCKAYASTTDITYDVTVSAGGTTYYSKTGLIHTPVARWKRTFWIGTAPKLHIRHDTAYLIASRAVPNYDQRIRISESLLAGYATALGNGKFVPMGTGSLLPAMETTGGRADIGIMPDTHVALILSMDKRAKDIALGNADAGGTWPACRRDDSTGPGAGYPLSVLNFPYATVLGGGSDGINPTTGKNEHLPQLSTVSQAHWDSSHQPGVFYLPYLLTADLYYLEGLHFWCTANIYQSNPYYRNKAQGLISPDQVRGQGWSIRTLAECAYVTPDDHPLKSAFDYWIGTNFAWYNQKYTDGNDNVLGIITGSAFAYNNGRGMAPWQDDFFTQALKHAVELLDNSAAKRLLTWKAKFQVSRIVGEGTCIMDAANYDLNARDSSSSPYYTTIGQCMAATIPATMSQYPCNSPQRLATASSPNLLPGDIDGYPDSTQGYPANMQPALAAAVDIGYPQADVAWAMFDARPTKPDYSTGPQFAIVPRTV